MYYEWPAKLALWSAPKNEKCARVKKKNTSFDIYDYCGRNTLHITTLKLHITNSFNNYIFYHCLRI